MDFNFTEEQTQIRDLCRQVLQDNCADDALAAFSKKMLKENGPRFSQSLWKHFTEAGLLGTAIPEAVGGSGFGIVELCLMCEEQGRHVAPIPLLPSLVLGGLPLAKYGSPAQQEAFLKPLAEGQIFLTAAIAEESMARAMRVPCVANERPDGWQLDGVRVMVPYARESAAMLVAATLGASSQQAVFLVNTRQPGVRCEFTNTGNHEPCYTVTFDAARADKLGNTAQGAEVVDFVRNSGTLASVATMIGVCEESARRTAQYTSERKQFETSIASFQNTSMKLADCYIDIEALRSAYYEALWKFSVDLPCAAEMATAKYWASMAGHRVTHACQHLHGGIGADVEYPLHRYYLWFKQMDLMLGGATKQLSDLGALLAKDDSIGLLKSLA